MCKQYLSRLTLQTNNNPSSNLLIGKLNVFPFDGLQSLAVYICHKPKKTEPTTSTYTNAIDAVSFTWVDYWLQGGLQKPLGNIFYDINSDKLFIFRSYQNNFRDRTLNIDCSLRMKQLFFRSRLFLRIWHLNQITRLQVVNNVFYYFGWLKNTNKYKHFILNISHSLIMLFLDPLKHCSWCNKKQYIIN